MKRKLLVFALVLAVLLSLCILGVSAEGSGYIGDMTWYFNSYTNTLYLDRINSQPGPMYRNANTTGTYKDWISFKDEIEHIVIGSGFTTITNNAFYFLTNLKSVSIPSTVTSIGANAFRRCYSLTDINIPSGVTNIGSAAFANAALTEITLPDGLSQLSGNMFAGCTSLVSVSIPAVDIGDSAFSGCTSLEEIRFTTTPTGAPSIGEKAFFDCSGLKAISIPEGYEIIYPYAFYRCTSLTSVSIPANMNSIKDYAFDSCTSLTKMSFEGTLNYINYMAFANCTSLENIAIPSGITELVGAAFFGCTNLKEVILPEGLLTLGGTFGECTSLAQITVPSTVTTFDEPFGRLCVALKEVRFLGNAPSFSVDAFKGLTLTAYYPTGNETWTETVLQDYQGAVTWKSYCQEHTYESTVTAPTCSAKGYTTHQCIHCDYSYTDTYVEPYVTTGHTYTNDQDTICDECGWVRHVDAEYPANPPVVHMFRMYDPNSGEHFYTGSEVEKSDLLAAGWNYEGIGFSFPVVGAPVYRLYDPVYGEHLYTMDIDEVNYLIGEGWNNEGIAFNTAPETEVPQYRLHNPNEKRGAYHFTSSTEERDNLLAVGWEYQGIGWYSCWK